MPCKEDIMELGIGQELNLSIKVVIFITTSIIGITKVLKQKILICLFSSLDESTLLT